MLVIRFSRTGKKNQAQFRIVLAENTAPVKGRFIERLGSWNPHQKEAVLKDDRIKYWLEKGAQASDSVHNLLVSKGILQEKKRVLSLTSKKAKEGEEKAESGEKVESKDAEEGIESQSADAEALADKKAKVESKDTDKDIDKDTATDKDKDADVGAEVENKAEENTTEKKAEEK